ncbi:MAG: cytochrome c, class [Edaphobacter sp.]|nr:cytochrome c, class [Edaphobacter sp.]
MGGPNLLRSQVTLSDHDGELIVPIIQGARQAMGMPAIGIVNLNSLMSKGAEKGESRSQIVLWKGCYEGSLIP